jgi:hypothetical protein
MHPQVIPLVTQYYKVVKRIISAVPVKMVDNIARFKRKMLSHDLPCHTRAIAVRVILGYCLKPCPIAVEAAKYMLACPEPFACYHDLFPAGIARYRQSVLAHIYSGTFYHLVDALSCDAIPFGKVSHA